VRPGSAGGGMVEGHAGELFGITLEPAGRPAGRSRKRGLWLPAAALTGEGPKPRLPRVPGVHDGSVGDDVVQRATITLQQDAQEP
jgi:hypothetical protein